MAAFPPSNLPSPQGPPSAPGASPAPVSPQLSEKGSPMGGSLLQMILAFLAGAGAPTLVDAFAKLRGKTSGTGKGAKAPQPSQPSPTPTPTPSQMPLQGNMVQGGGPQGIPPELLALLAQQGGGM